MFCCGRVAMNDGGKDTGGMAGEGWFRTSRDGATLVFAVGGRWTLATAAGLDEKLGQVTTAGVRQVRFDLSAVEGVDWAGGWLLCRTQRRFENDGAVLETTGAAPQDAALLQRMAPRERRSSLVRPQISPLRAVVERVGAATILQAHEGRDLLNFFGLVAVTAARVVLRSEEHTSELQSPHHLLCPLLLEKKHHHLVTSLQ